MRLHPRVWRPALMVAGLLLVSSPAGAGRAGQHPVIDIVVPEPSQQIDRYEGSLSPTSPVSGQIFTPQDPFDWWCLNVTAGAPLTVTVQRDVIATAGGSGFPNCGLVRGTAAEGDVFESLGQILAVTNNGVNDTATLVFTPDFTGPATVWVSSAGLTYDLIYTVGMSGGASSSDCGPTDLEVEKSVDDDTPNPGDTITFTVVVTNNGPALATGVVVTDLLPASVTYASDNPSVGTYDHTTGVWNIGVLARDAFETLAIDVFVDPGTEGATITNTVSVSFDQVDTTPSNNSASVDVSVGCPSVLLTGTITYAGNGELILPMQPDPGTAAVRVEDCANATTFDMAENGSYELTVGDGPIADFCRCASRPKADCVGFEGDVITGNDLIHIQNFIADIGPEPTPRQQIAGDLDGNGELLTNDALGVAQWIAQVGPCDGNTCQGQPNDNCAGTWQFVFPFGPMPDEFEVGSLCLVDLCLDEDVDIEGILLGDVDQSWPNSLPVAANDARATRTVSGIRASVAIHEAEDDVVTLSLDAMLGSGDELHHVIYSLEYDSDAFEYLGALPGAATPGWGWLDNPARLGVGHGVVHRLAGMPPMTSSGEVLAFRFRRRSPDARAEFRFSRLKFNDLSIHDVVASPSPSRWELNAAPNPFNPSTRIRFAIPAGAAAGPVPVVLRVHDISGRLVRTLLNEQRAPGYHDVVWNGTDDRGNAAATGIYFVRIRAGDWVAGRKIVLVK